MILIVCVDENGGMMFNHRRQSKDRILREDMLQLTAGSRLWMNRYSQSQFLETEAVGIFVSEDFLEQAGNGEYCFVEDAELSACRTRIEGIVLYRWNRRYPADVYLDMTLLEGFSLAGSKEFPGSSHEKITREIWNEAE
ncbi:MAG: ribonuclease Z [Clostridiales bacterium]|nr:ribonuclease Z [Clostridiales bacterium]